MLKKVFILFSIFLLSSFLFLYFVNFDTEEIIVAVVDTGVNVDELGHDKIVNGYDFVDFDLTPNDIAGHGTLMSKIIINIAPDCYILPVKFLKNNRSYTMNRSIAILYAIAKGADIINMSFNGDGDLLTKWAIAYGNSKGVLFVGSSGNKGFEQVDYPAKYEDVLAISGYNPITQTVYGNYDERVNFIAPATYENNNRCEIGTSISAAYISGTIAYLKSNYPNFTNNELMRYLCIQAKYINVNDKYEFPLIEFDKINEK